MSYGQSLIVVFFSMDMKALWAIGKILGVAVLAMMAFFVLKRAVIKDS